MNLFKTIFTRLKKEKTWTELDTLYSAQRMERVCTYLADRNIPCKVRAALLPMQMSTAAPIGTMTQPMWYLSVHPADVEKVRHYLRTERMD